MYYSQRKIARMTDNFKHFWSILLWVLLNKMEHILLNHCRLLDKYFLKQICNLSIKYLDSQQS